MAVKSSKYEFQDMTGLSLDELIFVSEFMKSTGDTELTGKLIQEIKNGNRNIESIIVCYSTVAGMKPKWLEDIENLLTAIENYKRQENELIERLSEALKVLGMDIPKEDITKTDTKVIREQPKWEFKL